MAFLGVGTSPVNPQVRAHLDLPEGVGLLVREVVRGSPAEGVISENDILLRLGDQWLVDPRQLSAVVRMRKPGDAVELEYVRKGVTAKATVKLGEREWTPLPEPEGPEAAPWDMPLPLPHGREARPEEPGRFPRLFPRDRGGRPEPEMDRPGDGARTEVRVQSRTVVSESVDGVVHQLTATDGDRVFEVRDGDTVRFRGPVNTEAEIDAIPAEYRDAFQRLSGGGRGLRIHWNDQAIPGPAL